MAVKHGITSSTVSRHVLDAGAVYKNLGESGEALLGATRGGSELVIEEELREMTYDGALGPVKGGVRIIKQTATLKVKFIEVSKAVLQAALINPVTTDYPAAPAAKTHDKFVGATSISTGDYLTNVAIVADASGSTTAYFTAILKNVLSGGNLTMTFADQDESGVEVTFKAYFDPSAMTTVPWEIRNPNIA